MRFVTSILIVLTLFPSTASGVVNSLAMNYENFESTARSLTHTILPLEYDGGNLGDIQTKISDSSPKSGSVNISELISILRPFVNRETLDRLVQPDPYLEFVSFEALAKIGVNLDYDSQEVRLILTITPTTKAVRKSSLYHLSQNATSRRSLDLANFSGAIDINYSNQWRSNNESNNQLLINAFGNFKGWALTNRLNYNQGEDNKWARQSSQLSYDWPSEMIRFQAGDLTYSSLDLMGRSPLFGVSIGTNHRLQPYRINHPTAETSFLLEQDSHVSVLIDGRRSSTIFLSSGTHSLHELPLVEGINEVVLEIEDVFGRMQLMRFDASQDSRLLHLGENEFSFTLGVPRKNNSTRLTYDSTQPMFSAYRRYGVSKTATVGYFLESNRERITFGTTALKSSRWGSTSVDFAASKQFSFQALSPAFKVAHRIRTSRFFSQTQWSWQARAFANNSQTIQSNNLHHQIRSDLTIPMQNFLVRFSIARSQRWSAKPVISKRVSLGYQLSSDTRLTLNIAHYNRHASSESSIGLLFSWNPLRKRSRLISELSSEVQSATYEYRKEGELGLSLRVNHTNSGELNQQQANISFVSPLVESRINVSRSSIDNNKSASSRTTSLGSSITFADGFWSLSRPTRGLPFAMFVKNKGVENLETEVVRGVSTRSIGSLNNLFPTTLPLLTPHMNNELKINFSDNSELSSLQQASFNIKPDHQGAALIFVGNEGNLFATATLIRDDMKPFRYRYIRLRSLKNNRIIESFTDEKGFVVLEDLESGHYQLEIQDKNQVFGTKLIMDDTPTNTVSFGEITLGVIR